jgi:hypothetical protein
MMVQSIHNVWVRDLCLLCCTCATVQVWQVRPPPPPAPAPDMVDAATGIDDELPPLLAPPSALFTLDALRRVRPITAPTPAPGLLHIPAPRRPATTKPAQSHRAANPPRKP